MNTEDIMRIAREAGASQLEKTPGFMQYLERFARAAYERGRLDENEACAKVCQEKWIYTASGFEMADYIRARRTSTASPATLIDPRGSLGEPIV